MILDVRTPGEYAEGHLAGARLLDYNAGEVHAAIPTLDPNDEYLLHCHSGGRSEAAMKLLQLAGFANVKNLGSLEQAAEATGAEIVVD